MNEIVHIASHDEWQQAQTAGEYRCASLVSEGFIHCSTPSQVAGVVERYYAGQSGLVVLRIDPDRLNAPLRWEFSPSVAEKFPHIYGPLNLEAVIETVPLEAFLEKQGVRPHFRR